MADNKEKELTPEQLEKISGGASSSSGYRSSGYTSSSSGGYASSSVYGQSSSSYRSSSR